MKDFRARHGEDGTGASAAATPKKGTKTTPKKSTPVSKIRGLNIKNEDMDDDDSGVDPSPSPKKRKLNGYILLSSSVSLTNNKLSAPLLRLSSRSFN